MIRTIWAAASAAMLISASCAHAQGQATSTLEAGLQETDIALVRAIAASHGSSRAERGLAQGAWDYWQLRDDRAGELLAAAAADTTLSAELRSDASAMLSGLRLRQSRYAEALAALDAPSSLPWSTPRAFRSMSVRRAK
jgi:hypothetical protein